MRFETGDRPVGRWSWNVGTDEWIWNEVMFRIHGYPPDTVAPDTPLVLDHQLDQDRAEAERVLAGLREARREFALSCRIRGRDGRITPVVVFGRPGDEPDVMAGWAVPLTDSYVGDGEQVADAEALERDVDNLRRGLVSRETIGQAKGLLRTRMGLSDEGAFETLRWISQHTNHKLSAVAEQLMIHAAEQLPVSAEEKRRFTRLLLDLIDTLRTP